MTSPRSTVPAGTDAEPTGHESRVAEDDHLSLKVWLRLLTCSTQIETVIRKRLRAEADISLARFDFMAQLHRQDGGITMSELSKHLMVTGGNVTGLADELVKEGLIDRLPDPDDGRTKRVSLTRKGRRLFEQLAAEHEAWIVAMFAGMPHSKMTQLHSLLGQLRAQLSAASEPDQSAPSAKPRRRRRPGTHT